MLNRRDFLLRSAMATAGARLLPSAPDATPTPVLAHTAFGPLRGLSENGVNVFRGVPFAQPPVGPLRFRASEAIVPWPGVRDAFQFSAAAVQPDALNIQQSEDCLYLNLWTPQLTGKLPVFVWIHGGGFTGGRSFDPLSDGTLFAREGIICITLAYRLGVFGFLDLGPTLGPAYAGGANNALNDIINALIWIQQNVGDFGGDPSRVTIGGESAGAKLTDMLMGIPSAGFLFHQVISESGGAERIWPAPRAAEIVTSFCTEWSANGASVDQLKTAPAADILAAQQRFIHNSPVHFPLRAEIDGLLVTKPPLDTIRGGSTRNKRLLLGTNRDESALFIGPHPAKAPGPQDLGNLSVAQFRPIEDRYQQLYPEMSPDLRRIRSLTAEEYWIPSLRVAEAHVSAGGTAFVYRFDFAEGTGRLANLAAHASELRFVWNHMAPTASPQDLQFATTLHAAWASFIRGETPAAPGLPTWPAYTVPQRPTMLLDTTSRVENQPDEAEFKAWTGLLTS